MRPHRSTWPLPVDAELLPPRRPIVSASDYQDLLRITVARMLELLVDEPEFDDELLENLAALASKHQLSHVTRVYQLLQGPE